MNRLALREIASVVSMICAGWLIAAEPQHDPVMVELKRLAPHVEWKGYFHDGKGNYIAYGRTLFMSTDPGNPTPRDIIAFFTNQIPVGYRDLRRADMPRVNRPRQIPSPVSD